MERLLIVGCGDIARRALPQLRERYAVTALVRSAQEAAVLRMSGVEPVVADLDRTESLRALHGPVDALLHLAPPGDRDARDLRTRNLVAALSASGILPRRGVYISTSGVYGDCGGAWVDESRPLNPATPRAARRVDAEAVLRHWQPDIIVLRVPGIYAADRLPLERLRRGTPVLRDEDDVYTNHIHADDLAAIVVVALERARAGAVYNTNDDSELKMGEWFDFVADRYGLARSPRVARAQAAAHIPPTLLSFMNESRRLSNERMKRELGVNLRYPTVREGVPFPSA